LLRVQCPPPQKKREKKRKKTHNYQYTLCLFSLNKKTPARSKPNLNRPISLEHRHYLAYNALGLALAIKGQLQEALKAYTRCLEINPAFSEARNNLGSLYQEMGYLDKAEEEFRKALSDPGYQTKELPAYNLARLYFLKEEYEEALAMVNNALRFNSRLAMAHNLKGLVLQRLNRFAQAIESFNQAVKLVPDDITFNFNLAVACFNDNQLGRAREIFERIYPLVKDENMKQQIASYLKQIHEK